MVRKAQSIRRSGLPAKAAAGILGLIAVMRLDVSAHGCAPRRPPNALATSAMSSAVGHAGSPVDLSPDTTFAIGASEPSGVTHLTTGRHRRSTGT